MKGFIESFFRVQYDGGSSRSLKTTRVWHSFPTAEGAIRASNPAVLASLEMDWGVEKSESFVRSSRTIPISFRTFSSKKMGV